MLSTGFIIFLGLVFLFIKLKRRTMLRLLRYDMALDVAVTLLTLAIHWGTFSGVMAATFAGLLTSVGTSAAKRLFGYIEGGIYRPGVITLPH
jgi:nucleoside permease NupC